LSCAICLVTTAICAGDKASAAIAETGISQIQAAARKENKRLSLRIAPA
jgi:hypothetical protein